MPKRNVRPRPPDNRLVVALAYDGLCTFELVRRGRRDLRPRSARDGRGLVPLPGRGDRAGAARRSGRHPRRNRRRPVPHRTCGHDYRSGLARSGRARPRSARQGPAARAQAGCTAALVLLGRVRAGRHRAARRQARDHALALRRAARPRLSRHHGRARRALHRRGQPAHRGGQRGGHRPQPPSHSPRLGRGCRQQRRAAAGGATPSRRRPGAVHRGARAGGEGRGAARAPARAHARRPLGRNEHRRAGARPPE